MQLKRRVMIASCLLLTGLGIGPAVGSENRILVQSTTSTQNSGLYSHILPLFQERTGIRVDVVAVGTGQAIRNASRGDADVLLLVPFEARAEEVPVTAQLVGNPARRLTCPLPAREDDRRV